MQGFSNARWIVWAVLIAALAGCAGSSPFSSGPQPAFSTTNGFDDPNRQPYSQLAQAFPGQNVAAPNSSMAPPSNPVQSSGNYLLTSMQKMAGGIADAVTPSPRVIAATDPTSLSAPDHLAGAELNYHAARVYEAQGKSQSAIGLYEKALHISPDLQPALVAYARLLDREGNFAKAESLYHRAIQQQPTNTIALNDLGMMYARQGRLPDAAAQLNRAIQLQPMNQRYRNNIAIVLIDAGRMDEAYGHLAAVHGEANAHYNLGFLLSQRQLNADALQHLNQALALNPDLEPARELASQLASVPPPNAPYDPRVAPVSAVSPDAGNYRPQQTIPGPNTRPLPPL